VYRKNNSVETRNIFGHEQLSHIDKIIDGRSTTQWSCHEVMTFIFQRQQLYEKFESAVKEILKKAFCRPDNNCRPLDWGS
jgi:hypothetical protein